jgi:hypothetical protein
MTTSAWLRVGGFLLLCVAVLVLIVSRRPENAETAPQREESIVFNGLHATTTQAFFLPGGSYRATWSAWGETPNEPPCTHSVALILKEGRTELVRSVQVPATGITRDIQLTDLEPGDYAFDVRSACAWSIKLSPSE